MLMTTRVTCLLIITALLRISAFAAGLPPWEFGMTKVQVASFKQFGPYRSFSNGDLETFNGLYHGRKHNIQFFFDRAGRLQRIGVYLGEGTDGRKAAATFQHAYELLQQDYGKVVVPEMKVARGSETVPAEVIAIGAAANADVTGKSHATPVKQPKDMRVSASIMRGYVKGAKWFYVAIFFDRHT
jgi:hypothetical protein